MHRALLAIGILIGALLVASYAGAHAVLESTQPADGALIAHAPAVVVLQFNEPVSPIFARVLDRSGRAITESAAVSVVDHEVRIALPASLPQGAYLVSYRMISADSHPVSGSFPFAIGATPGAWTLAAVSHDGDFRWRILNIVNRAIHLASLIAALGGALLLLLIAGNDTLARRHLRGVLLTAAAVGCVTAALAIGLQGALMAEARWDQFLEPGIWHQGAATTRGEASVAAIVGLGLIVAALFVVGRRLSTTLLLLGTLAALASFVVSGHAATVTPRWLGVVAWLVHVATVAFWIGSLIPLLKMLESNSTQAVAAIQRFSRLAVGAVAALLSAGVVMAAIQVQHIAALTRSDYGRLLILKIALVAGLFALAAFNKFRLTPALARGEPSAKRSLKRTIRMELGIGFTVIAVTAALSQQVPPRGMFAGTPQDVPAERIVVDSAGRTASIRISPASSGHDVLEVRLADSLRQPIKAVEVIAELSNPSAGIEPISRSMMVTNLGDYRYASPDFVVPGLWLVRIKAILTDFEESTFAAEIMIRK